LSPRKEMLNANMQKCEPLFRRFSNDSTIPGGVAIGPWFRGAGSEGRFRRRGGRAPLPPLLRVVVLRERGARNLRGAFFFLPIH
jgi:hypothetical protein